MRRNARKTGVPACLGRQAAGLSEQPGTAVFPDSRDGCLPFQPQLFTQSPNAHLQGIPFHSPVAKVNTVNCPLRPSRVT